MIIKIYVSQITSWVGYSNCAISPIIYACCNVTFRASFLRLLGLMSEEAYQRKVSSSKVTQANSKKDSEVFQTNVDSV